MEKLSPVVAVQIDGKTTHVDLNHVGALRGGFNDRVIALLGNDWLALHTSEPDHLIELWLALHGQDSDLEVHERPTVTG